jgi:hypothetical protein
MSYVFSVKEALSAQELSLQKLREKALANLTLRLNNALDLRYDNDPSCTIYAFDNEFVIDEYKAMLRSQGWKGSMCWSGCEMKIRPLNNGAGVAGQSIPTVQEAADRLPIRRAEILKEAQEDLVKRVNELLVTLRDGQRGSIFVCDKAELRVVDRVVQHLQERGWTATTETGIRTVTLVVRQKKKNGWWWKKVMPM